MFVRVAFSHVSSKSLHSGEPAYDGEPVVVQLARVIARDKDTDFFWVVDADGDRGTVHVSRLYNVYAEDDGQIELDSWGEPL